MIVEVLHGSKGETTCCGSPMKLLKENSSDGAKEKHYIEWIELIADGVSYKAFLSPGMAPTAQFMIAASRVAAREYCNIHGLWRGEA